MEKVTLDFEFEKYSREYGYFLIECYEGPEVIQVSNSSRHFWNYYSLTHLMVSITVPEERAVFFKLKFGNYRKIRPTEDELRLLKRAQEDREFYDKKLQIIDYISLIKYDKYSTIEEQGDNEYFKEIYKSLKVFKGKI